eukprot:jgi/Tetstr1/454280/TSEL_041199.t1
MSRRNASWLAVRTVPASSESSPASRSRAMSRTSWPRVSSTRFNAARIMLRWNALTAESMSTSRGGGENVVSRGRSLRASATVSVPLRNVSTFPPAVTPGPSNPAPAV